MLGDQLELENLGGRECRGPGFMLADSQHNK